MSADLAQKLEHYGTPEQIESTISNIKKHTKWEDFVKDYNYGELINPYSIKSIVQKYYNNPTDTTSPPPTATISPPPTDTTSPPIRPQGSLTLISEETLPTGSYSPFHESNALETWYSYKDKNGNVINTKTKYHGGKRKSRRNRKSRKSRKNLRKSNRRR